MLLINTLVVCSVSLHCLSLIAICLITTNDSFAFGAKISFELLFSRQVAEIGGRNNSIITVNGLYPAPTLRVQRGDQLVINVTNFLSQTELLNVHWHGIRQIGTPWSDGTTGVTNCPIYYGANYSYQFTVNVSGTYWYHPHQESMRAEGGFGFLIVEENPLLATYDSELLIVLADMYRKSYDYLDKGLLQFGDDSQNNWPGNGEAIMFNGIAGTEMPFLAVEYNKTYRVRILNAASLAYFNLAIAGHNMTVIQAGSTATKPISLQSLDINVAERFDVLITTDKKPLSYRINIQTNYQVPSCCLLTILISAYLPLLGDGQLPVRPL